MVLEVFSSLNDSMVNRSVLHNLLIVRSVKILLRRCWTFVVNLRPAHFSHLVETITRCF